MTAEEFQNFANKIPPEARAQLLEATRGIREYITNAHRVRERIRHEFPKLDPRLRAVASCIAARFL